MLRGVKGLLVVLKLMQRYDVFWWGVCDCVLSHAIVCDLMRFDAHRTRFGAGKALQIVCDEVCFTENWRVFYGVPSQSMMAFASRGVKVFRFLL